MTNLIEFIPAHVREYLETQDQSISKGLDFIANLDDEEDFITADQQLESVEKTARILRGFLYMRYSELSDRRTLSGFLARRGIPRATFYDYMDEAAVYARLPSAEACATVAQMGQVKARLLNKLPSDQLGLFLSGEPVLGVSVEDASTMTKDEFKQAVNDYLHGTNAELAKANQEIGRLSAKLEVTQHDLAEVREQLDRKFSDLPFPPWVSAVREESTVHGDTAKRALEGLSLALEEVERHTHKTLKDDALAEYRAGATQVYHQLVAVFSMAGTLLQHAHTFIPDTVVEHFDAAMPLTDAEMEARLEHGDRLRLSEKSLEEHRARQRAAQQKQGRGRPSKTAKVYAE